jgi:acetyl/propionyl-CoA carboxylase alpha subunit
VHPRRLFARVADSTLTVDVQPDGVVRVRAAAGSSAAGATLVPPRSEGGTSVPPAGRDEADGPPSLDVRAHYVGHGRVSLTFADRRTLVWAVDAGDLRWVFIDGDVLQVDIGERPGRRPGSRRGSGPESLAAPMPATVIRLLVKPGQAVQRGESLVLLEAMKMELPLRAPHDAVVAAIRCAEGDMVQPGTPLVDLAEARP